MARRVVITGAGVVTSIGTGAEAFWDALADGRSGAARVEVQGVPPAVAFPVPDLDAEERFGRRDARRMDRDTQLAAVAATLALEDAGDPGLPADRIGVAVGNAHGGMATMDAAYRALYERGADRVSPFSVPLALPNAPAAGVARVLGLHGPSSAVCTACAAGSDAIGLALAVIRDGRADAMLAGGAEAPLSAFTLAGYGQLGALARGGGDTDPADLSRPFDRARSGFVMGEGAGVLVLEEREHAVARGARVLAEVAGYGASCDAGHLTDPDPTGEGPATAIGRALEDAGLGPAGHRLRQRACHVDPRGRRGRGAHARAGGARPRAGLLHQGPPRPLPRRGRRHRGRGHAHGPGAGPPAARHQPPRPRRRARARPRGGRRAAGPRRRGALQLASASAGTTPRWSSRDTAPEVAAPYSVGAVIGRSRATPRAISARLVSSAKAGAATSPP